VTETQRSQKSKEQDPQVRKEALLQRMVRPQSLIFTIYGAYSRSIGGWMSVGALLELLREIGVEDAAVRSALSRFKRRGVLLSETRYGLAGYALSTSARKAFDTGDARVLERRESPSSDRWVLVAFSIPEKSRDLRYRLRSRLSRVGFAQVTGGLWIAPEGLEADARLVIESLGVSQHVDVFRSEHVAFRSLPDAVGGWWDLDSISSEYTDFATSFEPLMHDYQSGAVTMTALQAFIDYTRVLTSWRPLPYRDPGLPAAHLPGEWAGIQGTEMFFYFYDSLSALAQEHVVDVCTARNSGS
jgi:phenylacetic acid degradation operon negative regulatory protein|tara:strand:- start:2127 stop:3026 length:900 start_codon:yes stop_codon:yes gene_type:complete